MLAWVFAYVYTLTGGGPGTSSTVLELYIYNQGLRNSLPGMASAVAVILFADHAGVRGPAGVPAGAREPRGRVRVSAAVETQEGSAGRRARLAPLGVAGGRASRGRYPARSRARGALPRRSSWSRRRSRPRISTSSNPYSLPWPISLDNFGNATRGGSFLTWFKNSVILAVGSCVISTGCAALAAYAIARMRFFGRDVPAQPQHRADGRAAGRDADAAVHPLREPGPRSIPYQGAILVYSGLTLPFLDLHAHELLPLDPERAGRVGADGRCQVAPDPRGASCCRSPCRRS